jgi:spartin
MAKHPAYKNSSIVQNAAVASRLIVTGSGYLVNAINSGSMAFTQKTKPNPKPIHFSPAAQERIRKLNNLTHGAVGLSAATVGQVGKLAQNFGAKLAGRGEAKKKGIKGEPGPDFKPGVLNKSLIAFSTIADGIEQSAKNLLNSGSTAASTMVSHKYGDEAGQVARNLAGGVKNVGLVYIDATGVSRKAVIKSVAKGMVVGRMPDGSQLLVGEGDGGQIPSDVRQTLNNRPAATQALTEEPGKNQIGFGNSVPPSYTSGSQLGEPLGSTGAYPKEKH